MNLSHLKYAVEVARVSSITKAAQNLYISQPNLSRAIKEVEEDLGVTIFRRTSKGIIPTPEGEEFLAKAENIIEQMQEIESMYKNSPVDKLEFSISVPRSSFISVAFKRFVMKLDPNIDMELTYRETNAMRALNNVLQGNYRLAIISYQDIFSEYYEKLLKEKGLKSQLLWETNHYAVFSKDHPMASKDEVELHDLDGYLQIAQGDPYVPSLPVTEVKKVELSDRDRRIFSYDRCSQFEMVSSFDGAYVWMTKTPQDILDRYGLVQRPCAHSSRIYKYLLIQRKNYRLGDLDKQFIQELKAVIEELDRTIK